MTGIELGILLWAFSLDRSNDNRTNAEQELSEYEAKAKLKQLKSLTPEKQPAPVRVNPEPWNIRTGTLVYENGGWKPLLK